MDAGWRSLSVERGLMFYSSPGCKCLRIHKRNVQQLPQWREGRWSHRSKLKKAGMLSAGGWKPTMRSVCKVHTSSFKPQRVSEVSLSKAHIVLDRWPCTLNSLRCFFLDWSIVWFTPHMCTVLRNFYNEENRVSQIYCLNTGLVQIQKKNRCGLYGSTLTKQPYAYQYVLHLLPHCFIALGPSAGTKLW